VTSCLAAEFAVALGRGSFWLLPNLQQIPFIAIEDTLHFLLLRIQFDGIDRRRRLNAHSFVDRVYELLIFLDLLHDFSNPALIEEHLILIPGFPHETPNLLYLFLPLHNVALKYVNFFSTVHIDILHDFVPRFLLLLPAPDHDLFPGCLEAGLPLLHPRFSHHFFLLVDAPLVEVHQVGQFPHDCSAVVVGILDEWVSAEVEALDLWDKVEHPLIGCDFVVCEIDGGQGGAALPQVFD
jgi:hypothetical protein